MYMFLNNLFTSNIFVYLCFYMYDVCFIITACRELSNCKTCTNAELTCSGCRENWGLKSSGVDCEGMSMIIDFFPIKAIFIFVAD